MDETAMCTATWTLWWTGVAAFAAVASAFSAAVYTHFTYRLLLAQIEPCVVVTVVADSDRPTILMIRVRNVGASIARDIRFYPSRPIPWQAWGMDSETAQEAKPMTDGPLLRGIAALGPQDTRDITWGQFGGLLKAMEDGPITLEYKYLHDGREIEGVSILEVGSFICTDASERPLPAIARSLKTLEREVRGVGEKLVRINSTLDGVNRDRDIEGNVS